MAREHKAQTAFRKWSNSYDTGPLKSVQHEALSWSSTHREGATPARFGPRPRNRDRVPSFSRMDLQKEMNREISRITKLGAVLFLLLLCSSVLLVALSPHLPHYPFCALLSFSLPSLLSPSVIESWNHLVGNDLKDHLVPTGLPWAGTLFTSHCILFLIMLSLWV